MARGMPSAESTSLLLLHPTLSLSLAVLWIAASIVVLATVCASCHRKPATSSPTKGSVDDDKSAASQDQEDEQESSSPPMAAEERITELEAAIHGPIYPTSNLPAGSTSKRRLSVSLSMGQLKGGLARIKTKKEGHHGKEREESLWKKTIILGEKCKMQQNDIHDHNQGGGGAGGGDDQETNGGGGTTQSQQPSRNTSFASAAG